MKISELEGFLRRRPTNDTRNSPVRILDMGEPPAPPGGGGGGNRIPDTPRHPPRRPANPERRIILVVAGVIGIIILLLFAGSFVTVIPAGCVGVKDTFGVVDSDVFQPGLHLKNPFTDVVVYSTRTQAYQESSDTISLDILSNEGLKVTVDLTVLYHIVPEEAPHIYKTVGTSYQDIIMRPPVHSVPRDIISRYDAKTLYSANTQDSPDRLRIENDIKSELVSRINAISNENSIGRGIVIEQVAIRNIVLPPVVTSAIENKLSMEQQIQQKQFEVDREKEEANRKIAEATGIAEANRIISNSINDQYLKWYWLQNLKEHTSTAYLQLGEDGFPVALTKGME